MDKQDLINNLKHCRKKYGKYAKETYKAIYRLIQNFPEYKGHEENWLSNNQNKLKTH